MSGQMASGKPVAADGASSLSSSSDAAFAQALFEVALLSADASKQHTVPAAGAMEARMIPSDNMLRQSDCMAFYN
jgi:hypothetical protein